ncbi:MAG TPA: hypothetical protein ENN40_05715 [Candidatus Aminicenantes bacterium]|nr:hypothetical protein [Candidatus Aminicenantes bacterium]
MKKEYDPLVCRQLEQEFHAAGLFRPFRRQRYEPGQHLELNLEGVFPAGRGYCRLEVESFVGGGFAGQVYRVRVEELSSRDPVGGIVAGGVYAMKILVPPSGFSRLFRNFLHWVGFQGPFQLQVNPAAARAGSLWQALIRRGASLRMGGEEAVNRVHATFTDPGLGSCGELSDWVDGRTWRLEVDDRLDLLWRHRRGKRVSPEKLGSPEYRAKKRFMADLVALLHAMGAREFARQYEWSTAKSQPNCLKRRDEVDPEKGLVAVDFRAGLTLLPFLPMSPGDVKLIWQGMKHGRLVQFDRGNVKRLKAFIDRHADTFADMGGVLAELEQREKEYRDSLPDITHHHVRLSYSRPLWSRIWASARRGWEVRGISDPPEPGAVRPLNLPQTWLFALLGLIPLLGKFLRRLWRRRDWRRHYAALFSRRGYVVRALKGKIREKVIRWHRGGRMTATRARKVAESVSRYLAHLPFSILPAGLHRLLTDRRYAAARLHQIFVRPVRLYFSAPLREQWLRDMVAEGRRKHILSEKDADTIHHQLDEPFIQKYLKSLAVHVCTMPVTQVVSVIVSWIYVRLHPELSGPEVMAAVAAIVVLFQITPISPGSLVRGIYVLVLVIRERNLKDYKIALPLSFFKYIGYLAFPIQMTYRYPTLARFMAGHWATEAVHVVPVFGEAGALLEHAVFNLFYNWPLTLRRRLGILEEYRRELKTRRWHLFPVVMAAASAWGLVEWWVLKRSGIVLRMADVWWLAMLLALVAGALVARWARGAATGSRVLLAVAAGALLGVVSTGVSVWISNSAWAADAHGIFVTAFWRVFALSLAAVPGAFLSEFTHPLPEGKGDGS